MVLVCSWYVLASNNDVHNNGPLAYILEKSFYSRTMM